ncbi:hypothetical protein [Ralstonia soli]|uniref:Winged helix-turn helix domain-containing protein n=1 Tax=Ralstonia soli TaxID=2953896 RepID=A0ABT1AI17_9RALS|nr:hypothetical protein [Ralstonia soli]MCO5397966.1 hypothetical protein [Ralstonia soli]
MSTRNKHSKLDRPEVVAFLRRCTVARLSAADKGAYSLQNLANRIEEHFHIKANKSTIHRFLKVLGINFAWEKVK